MTRSNIYKFCYFSWNAYSSATFWWVVLLSNNDSLQLLFCLFGLRQVWKSITDV